MKLIVRGYAIRPPAGKLRDQEYARNHAEKVATRNDFTCSATGLIERYPVVLPEPVAWHEEFREWQSQRRAKFSFDPSMLEEEKDTSSKRQQKKKKKAKAKEGAEDDAADDAGHDEEKDFDAASTKGRTHAQLIAEFMSLAAARVTSADRAGDTKSLKRCLDKRLFLVTRMRGQTEWGFAGLADHADGEPIHETAQRAVWNLLDVVPGEKAMLYTISMMPNAVHVADKRKTFYFRMFYNRSELKFKNPDQVEDYAWLTRDEVLQRLPERVTRDMADAMSIY